MRVIAGKARRILLKTVDSTSTRPTTDRYKETLFNMINNDLYDTLFLDLFSGSGGIGIEALSRGARKAYFVENNKQACECIKSNLKATHLEEDGVLISMDVFSALKSLELNNMVFDYIFMDPPYNNEIEKNVLLELVNKSYVDKYTTIIVEASSETRLDYLEEFGYRLIKKKEYKTNYHAFLRKA